MKHNITFALTPEEISEMGFKPLSIQMSQTFISNIMEFIENKKVKPKSDYFFDEDQITKRLKGYAKGFTYEQLPSIENKLTDFCYDGQTMRLSYIIGSGKKEAIPIATDYYISWLWLTLQNIWLKKKGSK